MKRLLSRRPSPAMVVAVIALVIAMVGTGYAASLLPKNSVGTKQIKKNAVTSAKVKNKTLIGKDINLNKLGTVPSANVANGLVPPEAVHLVGAPGEPGFQSGSSNFGSVEGITLPPAGFYKDHDGIVHLQGLVKVGASGPIGTIFNLPAGFRPATNTLLFFDTFCSGVACAGEASSTLLIGGSSTSLSGLSLDGAVVGSQETVVSLDGITFRAAS